MKFQLKKIISIENWKLKVEISIEAKVESWKLKVEISIEFNFQIGHVCMILASCSLFVSLFHVAFVALSVL